MKNLLIVANWKSHKTESESINWIQTVRGSEFGVQSENKKVIVCPSFTLLPILKSYILNQKSSIKLGAQDISPYDEGPYTGEISGRQLVEFVDYVIIGHSERRTYFQENEDILTKKVAMAKKYNLTPIFCIQNEKTKLPNNVEIVAYEPVKNIGTGRADNPQDVERIVKFLKEKQIKTVLYGGSINPENVRSFTSLPDINGVLVGAESLDAGEFSKIITNA